MHFQKSLHILNMHRFQLLVELSTWKPLLLLPLQACLISLLFFKLFLFEDFSVQIHGLALEQLASEFNTVGLHSKLETPV